ncbi:hypothetical protein [Desulfofustis limnaeus]|uniref:Uncharacterized protein n=1 Tax=Desulfofustis limnaeus TaxID=2740163 RepID=A0ABM7W8M8_9BACT|nr:hypothetical protein [Desulfofustis limnaeus]MDX9894201.1 hypothetical protein [Desulfofustis sp.]BDD87285.1 hypothetical protein DPPLL_16500 [Desulfofustis limnaeus]
MDAGNLLFGTSRSGQLADQQEKSELIAQVYGQMGYDAVAVGPYDLLAGIDVIRKTAERGVPWVSANVKDEQGRLVCEPYRLVQVGALRIAVIGMTGSATEPDKTYTVDDDLQPLRPIISSLAGENDLILLLSSLSNEQNREVARLFPDVAIIIQADPQQEALPAQVHDRSLVVQPNNRGRYLGFLRVDWTGAPWGIAPEAERVRLQERIASLTHQLHRISRQNDRSHQPVLEQKRQQVERLRVEAREALAHLEQQTTKDTIPLPSEYQSFFLPLDASTPEDPSIRDLLDTADQLGVSSSP